MRQNFLPEVNLLGHVNCISPMLGGERQVVRGDGHWKRFDQVPFFLHTEYLCCKTDMHKIDWYFGIQNIIQIFI